jgi:hypothetical protein
MRKPSIASVTETDRDEKAGVETILTNPACTNGHVAHPFALFFANHRLTAAW